MGLLECNTDLDRGQMASTALLECSMDLDRGRMASMALLECDMELETASMGLLECNMDLDPTANTDLLEHNVDLARWVLLEVAMALHLARASMEETIRPTGHRQEVLLLRV